MTKQRIEEIKRRTVKIAIPKIKEVDFSDSVKAAIEIGMILGELEYNLERELYREMNLSKRMSRTIKSKENGDKKQKYNG